MRDTLHEILEYILPVVFASGEAMIAVLIFTVLIIVGRGKLQPSEKQLFIERAGQYRMVLAPGLNLAQPFIEQLAKQIAAQEHADGWSCRFEIRDRQVATAKQPAYLLEVSKSDGTLQFEAKYPQSESNAVADEIPHPAQPTSLRQIEQCIRTVAQSWDVKLQRV